MGTGIPVVGSISIDMVAHSPRIPGPGQNVCDAEFQTVPGVRAPTRPRRPAGSARRR